MRIELHAAGLHELEADLEERADRAEHLGPALDGIAADFLKVQRRRFSGGAQWQPLSPEWAVRKAAGGRSPLPLAGGALEQSLTRSGARFAVKRTQGHSVTLGTSDPVAHLHRDGTRRMPRRPPVSVSQADERRWTDIYRRHLAGDSVRAGL